MIQELCTGSLSKIGVVIPAYNPLSSLTALIHSLLTHEFSTVIVVDDGSSGAGAEACLALTALPRVVVLRHAVNAGKGRALKTAFNHCLVNYPDLLGVVTADADGQHSPADIVKVAHELVVASTAMVLGVREFGREVPWRSRIGNSLTRSVFKHLYGIGVRDTQTGLRAIPMAALPGLLKVAGERYEYETNMLINAVRQRRELREVGIATIYLDGNSGSHFNVFRDSMKIYFGLLRFLLSSLVTSAVDFLVFALVLVGGNSLAAGMLWGRGVAQAVNFLLNKHVVFRHQRGGYGVFLTYLSLVALLGVLAYLAIGALQQWFGLGAVPAKLIVESVLFVLSFSAQHDLVFSASRDEER